MARTPTPEEQACGIEYPVNTGHRHHHKTQYGKQNGAQVSYNPHKPRRPSHALHAYWVGNLRLVPDVAASPGKERSAAKARPGFIAVLDKPDVQQRPALPVPSCARAQGSGSC